MKKAIYKIENKVNHKIYIGQSINPKNRFNQHCMDTNSYISLISKAIHKYGKSNFTFSILEWTEDYKNREKYYINKYMSLTPYGYNIQIGGEAPPRMIGNEHPNKKINLEIAKKIQKDLQDYNLPLKTVIKKYMVTKDIVRHINDGSSWNDNSLNYPIRPTEKELNNLKATKVISLLKNTNKTQKEIGKIVGWNRSAITMINIGKNHRQINENYPIRK